MHFSEVEIEGGILARPEPGTDRRDRIESLASGYDHRGPTDPDPWL